MSEYDESDDIADLLRSSLREQANATQQETPSSENPEAPADSEAQRRRRARLDFNDELKPLTE